jgi:hypothetical protein
MKTALRTLAIVLALATVAAWLATGANRGWTKTSREIRTLDEITGIEGISHETTFAPGVDFLGAGLLAAGVCAGAALFFRKPNHKLNPTEP